MNYTQLTEKKKAQIDILLQQGLSMRKVAGMLNIHHSTISRYKRGVYKKRNINIEKKYEIFIKYLFEHYDKRHHSIEVCIHNFRKRYKTARWPSVEQTYKWIKTGKISLSKETVIVYSSSSEMMQHVTEKISENEKISAQKVYKKSIYDNIY